MKLGNEKLDVVQVYWLKKEDLTKKKENLYAALQDTIDKMSHRNNLLVIEDTNEHVGIDRSGAFNVAEKPWRNKGHRLLLKGPIVHQ